MRLQIVLAIASGIAPLEYEEREAALDSFRNSTRKMKCQLSSYRFGDRWMELILNHSPGFDIGKAMANFKAISSRKIHQRRGGLPGIWAPGYLVQTIGDPLEPESAFLSLIASDEDQ